MLKTLFRAAALLTLCALLVFAPELLASVSAPYSVHTRPRVLLRIALCTEDREAASAFYQAVSSYQKKNPALHLRIRRVSADRIVGPSSPDPDLYVFAPGCFARPQTALLPLGAAEEADDSSPGVWDGTRYAAVICSGSGHPLLAAVSSNAREPDAAKALLLCLSGGSAPEP